jgi:hypothetical protein
MSARGRNAVHGQWRWGAERGAEVYIGIDAIVGIVRIEIREGREGVFRERQAARDRTIHIRTREGERAVASSSEVVREGI